MNDADLFSAGYKLFLKDLNVIRGLTFQMHIKEKMGHEKTGKNSLLIYLRVVNPQTHPRFSNSALTLLSRKVTHSENAAIKTVALHTAFSGIILHFLLRL